MEFEIHHQMIRRTDGERIIEGNTELMTYFTFTDDWEDIGRTAYFRNIADEHGISMVIMNDRCKVPWEVLKKGYFTVTVYGGEAQATRKRITTNTAKVRVFANRLKTPYNQCKHRKPHVM